MASLESITGVFDRVRWMSPEGDFVIAFLSDGRVVKGRIREPGELTPGLTYEFYGKRSTNDHGEQFEFKQFLLKQPHSKEGIIAYLTRYAPHVGPAVASNLWDAFGPEAVKVLRINPEQAVAASRYLTLEKAHLAAAALKEIAAVEDTRIELTNLFAGRGFPYSLINECIDKWGILAVARVKRDPFVLLVEEMPGCGFARCDRLYADLGLPLERLKRQVICLWNVLHSDTSGHTWIDAEHAFGELGRAIGGVKVARVKATKMGCRAGWLARRRDENGKLWLAEGKRAEDEKNVAERLNLLRGWTPPVRGEIPVIGNELAECETVQMEGAA